MAKANATGEAENTATPKERTFPLDVLRTNCTKLFGVTSSTFAGATASLSDGEYTIADMKNKIKTWLKKEVK